MWMRVKPPPQSASCFTPECPTRSAKCTMVPLRWTGWSRSRSVVSLLPLLRRPASGAVWRGSSTSTALILLIPLATLISQLRSSAPCVCSMPQLLFSAAPRVCSRRPKRYGARLISTKYRAWSSSIKWTVPAQTICPWSSS